MDRPSRRRARTRAMDPPMPRHSGRHQPDSGCKNVHHDRPWSAEQRDWAALPDDVLLIILGHVPQADILLAVGLVCASWRRLAHDEPQLWRRIDLAAADDEKRVAPAGWKDMACSAVRRSAGRCESFRGRVTGPFLLFLADSASSLRSLHMTSRLNRSTKKFMTVVAKKLPLLEQFVQADGWIEEACLVALVNHCPCLQLLHAGGCHTSGPLTQSLRETLKCKIKDLRLPRFYYRRK